MTLAAGTKLDSYEVLGLLGAGGMGEVYRARDPALKREVAIKVLPPFVSRDPDRLQRFEQEAQAAAALEHPNILAVHQFGAFNGSPYLVCELLAGESLRHALQRGPLPVRKAIDYGIQIARGLAAAHDHGITHRDLKPDNLFITKDGHIKILDFGLAKLKQPQQESDGNAPTQTAGTNPGMIMGTAGYMSPEQVRGQHVDHRTDIFAFGAILYEMLTGRRAFQRSTSAETMTAILNDDPPAISQTGTNIPPALQRVANRCLEKSPEQRFHSASDLAFALDALSDSGASPAVIADRRAIFERLWLVGGTVAVLILALLAYLWKRIPPAVPQVESVTQITDDGEVKDEFSSIDTDGARVYFTEKYAGNFRLAQVAASGGPVAPVPTQIPAPFRASIAPDFSGLLVTEGPYGRHPLWFQPLPGGDPRRIGDLETQSAAFTPDGKQIVYMDGAMINIADRDGSNAHKLADLSGWGFWPTVSPDGKKIRAIQASPEYNGSLWEVASDGNDLHRLTTVPKDLFDVAYGRWTPDGRYFLFANGHEGRTDIWAISEKSGFLSRAKPVAIQLTNGPLSCTLPTPSRDGNQIFARCAKLRGELVRYDQKLNQFMPFLGGISATDVDFSRDGAWVVYLSYPDQSLWRMRADGRDRVRLTYSPITASRPKIAPDGRRVVFAQSKQGSKSDLYMVEMEGRAPEKIVDEPAGALFPDWSPDGNLLAFDAVLPNKRAQMQVEIQVFDLKSGKVSVIPQSSGKVSPVWITQEMLVAMADNGSKIFRYDFKTQAWSDLGNGPFSDCGTTDGKYVYCTTMEPSPPAAVRIRVTDGHLEPVADLSRLNRIVTYGYSELSLSPTGELLFTRDTGTQEIYALNILWP
jgi:Tol biopolymer transport system component